MLSALSVRNIVLIDQLDFGLDAGLTVLTGETGAGKSILLDALTLALGGRGDASLVRKGAESGQVVAVLQLPADHPARAILRENAIEDDDETILRRVQFADGRTRAFVNDQPVSATLLQKIGALVVEIDGQHDDRALVDVATHRALLDAFGSNDDAVGATRTAHETLAEAQAAVADQRAAVAEAAAREDYARHVVEELQDLAPEAGEEAAAGEGEGLAGAALAAAFGSKGLAVTPVPSASLFSFFVQSAINFLRSAGVSRTVPQTAAMVSFSSLSLKLRSWRMVSPGISAAGNFFASTAASSILANAGRLARVAMASRFSAVVSFG